MSMPQAEVIYAFDPLCGWCYGFSPVISKLRAEFGSNLNWRIMSGGLVTGPRERPIREMRGYLYTGMAAVTMRTGQHFGEEFLHLLDEGSWVSRSEPACRAIFAVQHVWPNAAMDFAQELCAAFYKEGKKPDTPETIALVGERCGIRSEALLEQWSRKTAMQQTSDEFANAARLGINGYPALHLSAPGGLKRLVNGCVSHEDARAIILQQVPALRMEIAQ